MKLIKQLLEMPAKKTSKKIPIAYAGKVKQFGEWCQGRGDLWHPAFPEKFVECVQTYLHDVDENVVYKIGEYFSDHLHSASGDLMLCFLAFAKEHAMPKMDDKTGDIDENEIEAYVKQAIEWIFPMNKHSDILPK